MGRVIVRQAPEDIGNIPESYLGIFLAGSIDMGAAEDWQTKLIGTLENGMTDGIAILNPRRDDWDSSWKQSIHDPQFKEQVDWELTGMDSVDIIVMNFLGDSKSPITLLELGLMADSGKLIVCCPYEFYRRGNVEVICDRYDIPLFDNIDDLIKEITSP
jgi:hypothetical protein